MPFLAHEDRARSGVYAAERGRQATLAAASSLDEWLSSLDLTIAVEPLAQGNLDRAAQLLNKTNQMNLSTRRLSEVELRAWADDPRHTLLTFRVADRFGDYGLTAIVGLDVSDGVGHLTDYLLSCRVMGRQVEETMLHVAVAHCRAQGARQLIDDFRTTPRNAPYLEFFRK
jgi:FkbH-like protein